MYRSLRILAYWLILAGHPVSVITAAASASSNTTTFRTAASQFKAPSAATSPDLAASWKAQDEALWAYVESHVPAVLDHTGVEAFDEHLKGVQAVLRHWEAPEYLASAGLFHSIYGTEGFQGFSLPLSERSKIQSLIGPQAEKLCFIFCMVDRSTVDQTVMDWNPDDVMADKDRTTFTFRARPELGRFELRLTKEEWLDFIELTLADWLEQVEGASSKPSDLFLWNTGTAYAYRRLAYRKMSQLLAVERAPRLATVTRAMLEAVMATESPETRHLVQPRTPPMSKASAAALDALRAMGEDIPEDLSPQPGQEAEECSASS
jgi:hypothetical protein